MQQRTFDEMGAPLETVPFCVLDLETTGGSASAHDITEIGAVKYLAGEEIGRFQALVNPGKEIPPMITILTGITHAMVIEAPPIEEVFPTFLEFLGEAVIVGHNVRFDMSFLNAAGLELGYGRLGNRFVDTLGLARRLCRNEVRNLKLASLAAYFRSPVTPNHRALADAEATAYVFHALLERVGTLGVTALDDLLQLPTARGSADYRKISLADELPRRPGVYFFKDRDGSIFYVGKAKNLRTRVRSYFYGDNRRSVTNMLRELAEIEYRVCETELEASVTELRLIHANRPRYNRRSKPPKSSHWVKLTNERFPRLSLVRTPAKDALLYLGPYRSRKSAETVMTAIWDATPIRRCTGRAGSRSAPCGFAQLGVSACPCDGSMSEEEYRTIVDGFVWSVDHEPSALLEPLRARMLGFAMEQRYEEAGWARDRHRALARSLERRAAWQAMGAAGLVWAEQAGGEGALIEGGRLVAAWRDGKLPLSSATPGPDADHAEVPSSVQVAEEADLIWQWLTGGSVRVTDSSHAFLPPQPLPDLAA